jgi:hypothetical protein
LSVFLTDISVGDRRYAVSAFTEILENELTVGAGRLHRISRRSAGPRRSCVGWKSRRRISKYRVSDERQSDLSADDRIAGTRADHDTFD